MSRREPVQTWTYENDDGDEIDVALPGKYEVCGRCQGKGTHVNPSIDGHGITESEWADDWSADERETYLSGGYDVTCHTCAGKRVVWVVDLDAMEPVLRARYEAHLDDEAAYARLCKMERDYGC